VARRADRINALANEIGGTAIVADVTDEESVAALARQLSRVDVLVNNAGGARGLAPVADADLEHWRWMWETNVLGTLRVTRALLPKLIDSGDGLIITVTRLPRWRSTTAGPAIRRPSTPRARCTARCAGSYWKKPVRLTEIAPGAVETEFSLVRFDGDEQRADAVYTGITRWWQPTWPRSSGSWPPAFARRPGPDRHPAARSGQRLALQPPELAAGAGRGSGRRSGRRRGARQTGRGRRGDRRGHRDCVDGGRPFAAGSADIATQVFQSTAQSQMSPSE